MPILGYTAAEVAAMIEGSERSGDGWRSRCPAHNGADKNLSITDSSEGVVVVCHSHHCSIAEITAALGINARKRSNGTRQETVYEYHDAAGHHLYDAVRIDEPGKKKKFFQRRADPENPGQYIHNLHGVETVLFRLPKLTQAVARGETILIVEGEKDVFTAEQLGFTATTSPMGAGKWKPHYSEYFRGAPVVVTPDRDEPGRKHAEQVLASLAGIAATTKVIHLPGLPAAGDLSDWVQAGGTRRQLQQLIEAAEPIETGQELILDAPVYEGETASTRAQIYSNERTHVITQKCIDALATSSKNVFQRAGAVVMLAKTKHLSGSGARADETYRIVPAQRDHVLDELSRTVDFFRPKRGKWVPADVPDLYVSAVITSREHPYPVLAGISTTPTLKADGSIITEPGYDPDTGLYYIPSAEYPSMLESPDRSDAQAAFQSLLEPFEDFPFAEDWHRSAAVAAILSLICRHLLSTVPLFAVTSTTAGAGKGLLVDTVCMIATGITHPISILPREAENATNALYSIGASGQRVTIFDNISGIFGSDVLDAALTKPVVSTRKFHAQETAQSELQTVFFVTGNNVRFRGDLVRRTIPITLLPMEQSPETRTNFKHRNLQAWTREHHPRLLVDALTILRAYLLGGKPSQGVTYGSFEGWSDLIRSSLLWAGAADPCAGRSAVESEADTGLQDLSALLDAWYEAFPNAQKYTMAELLDLVKREAKLERIGDRSFPASETILSLGYALTTFDPASKGRPLDLNARALAQRLPLTHGRSRPVGSLQLHSGVKPRGRLRIFWVEDLSKGHPGPEGEGTEPNDSDDTDLRYVPMGNGLPF